MSVIWRWNMCTVWWFSGNSLNGLLRLETLELSGNRIYSIKVSLSRQNTEFINRCLQRIDSELARQNLQPGVLEENLSRASTVPYYAHGRQRRCQEDPVSLPSGRLEKTTRSSPHHVSQHRPTGSETTPPCAPRSSRFGSEPPSVEDDVDVGGWSFPVAASQIWNSLPDTVVPAPIENFFISTILYLLAL